MDVKLVQWSQFPLKIFLIVLQEVFVGVSLTAHSSGRAFQLLDCIEAHSAPLNSSLGVRSPMKGKRLIKQRYTTSSGES